MNVLELRCPQCGCRAAYVMMLAEVKCVLNTDGSIGKTAHVGRRRSDAPARYACAGGHVFAANVDPVPQEGG